MRLRTPAIAAAAAIAAVAIACAVVLPSSSTSAAYIARVTNATNTAATASTFTCAQAATQDSAVFSYPLADATSTTVAADISGNNRAGTYFYTRNTNTSASRSCPRDPAGAYVLAGIVVPGNTAVLSPSIASPTTFSLELWFKNASTTSYGQLMGFGSSNNTTIASLVYNRQLYLSTTGNLVFGISAGTTITSPATFKDTNWHHVLVTVSGTSNVMYVDGVNVASGTPGTVTPASGYWHMGFDALTGWPNATVNMAYTGSLRYTSLYPAALSAGAVANHYRAATPAP